MELLPSSMTSCSSMTSYNHNIWRHARAWRDLARGATRAIIPKLNRRGLLSRVCQILNFENRTINKGDMAKNVKQTLRKKREPKQFALGKLYIQSLCPLHAIYYQWGIPSIIVRLHDQGASSLYWVKWWLYHRHEKSPKRHAHLKFLS